MLRKVFRGSAKHPTKEVGSNSAEFLGDIKTSQISKFQSYNKNEVFGFYSTSYDVKVYLTKVKTQTRKNYPECIHVLSKTVTLETKIWY